MGQLAAGAFEIKLLELRPLGRDDQRVAAGGHVIHVRDIGGVREHGFGFLHRLRVEHAELRAFFLQPLAQFERGRHAHVVGVLFEGQSEHADGLVLQDPERVGDLFDEAFHLPGVDLLHFLEQREVIAQRLGNLYEGAEVFREATAAEAQPGVEEAPADARVHAHAQRDFLDVRAAGLADDGDGVNVGNFQGEEGIGGVFDQLGGVDVGDDDGGFERLIDFLHRGDGTGGAGADDNPIGLHQIFDGETFAEEFGVAHHVELHLGLAVALDGFGHLVAGAHGHGALVHDDLVARHGGGDVAGHDLDETQIDGAVGLRRGGHGDEDDVGVLDAFAGAGGETEAPGGDVALDHFFEARLVDGDAAGLEHLHLVGVVIDADDVVADLGKAGAGDEADVAGANDGEFHVSQKKLTPDRRSDGVKTVGSESWNGPFARRYFPGVGWGAGCKILGAAAPLVPGVTMVGAMICGGRDGGGVGVGTSLGCLV